MSAPRDRLLALDGVRGVAITLVVLTHISTIGFRSVLPESIGRILFSGGITGVSLLFLLSGFFMALAYPNPTDRLAFLQKRFTRIFPVFLPMVILSMLIRVFDPSWYTQLGLFGLLVIGTHVLWVYGVKRLLSRTASRMIFLLYILVQIMTAALYAFWIMRHPPVYFFEKLPYLFREFFIGLANGTLTLQFGTYIPLIDGVYWSLASEVLFYILYAFVLAPLRQALVRTSSWMKGLIFLTAIPFFIGLDLFARRFMQFSIFQPALCFFFLPGMVLGAWYRRRAKILVLIQQFFARIPMGAVFFFFSCVFLKDYSLRFVHPSYYATAHILWSLPLTLSLALVLDQGTRLYKILSYAPIVFVGSISYSLYLLHTPVLHAVESLLLHEASVFETILSAVVTSVVAIVLSLISYMLLEKPYFYKDTRKKLMSVPARIFRDPRTIVGTTSIALFCAFFLTYQSNFSLFSLSVPLSDVRVLGAQKVGSDQYVVQDDQRVRLTFRAPQNNLGILTFSVVQKKESLQKQRQELHFRIRESSSDEWIVHNTYKLEQIGESLSHPFGFPLQDSSAGKTYVVELSLAYPDAGISALVDFSTLRAVYPVDKRELFADPASLFAYLTTRIKDVWANTQAKTVFSFVTPLLFLTSVLIFSASRRDLQPEKHQ